MHYYIITFFLLFDLFFQEENKAILYVTFPVYFLPNSIYSFSLNTPKGKIISNYYSEIYTTLNINNQNYPLFIRPNKGGPIEITSKHYKSNIANIYIISVIYNKMNYYPIILIIKLSNLLLLIFLIIKKFVLIKKTLIFKWY